MNWNGAWLIANVFCIALAALANAEKSSKTSKRDDIMGLHLGLGDDLLGSNFESNLLKDEEKHEDANQRAAFPIMDAFKEHTLLTADDLKEKVENDYSDQGGIHQAVENALKKLHKKKQQAVVAAHPHAVTPHAVTAKELIDEVVQQEIASHLGNNAAQQGGEARAIDSEEVKGKLYEKLEEMTSLETKLFTLIRDVKGFLSNKENAQANSKDDSSDDDSDLDDVTLDSLVSKRSEIPFNIDLFRRNVSLVESFIRDALKDDFTINPSAYAESESDSEDKKNAKQGDTRDLLGKKETQKALLKEAVPGEIEDIPVSSLERDIDENDTVASDHGISRDALVDSPFSSLDYKKVTGKRSRHYIS